MSLGTTRKKRRLYLLWLYSLWLYLLWLYSLWLYSLWLYLLWLYLLWLRDLKARIAVRAEESAERGGRTLNGSQLPLIEANRDYETPLHFAEHFYADMQAAIVSRVTVGTAVGGVATVVQP